MNKIKILIVEDEPMLLKTLEDFLGFQDYAFRESHDWK